MAGRKQPQGRDTMRQYVATHPTAPPYDLEAFYAAFRRPVPEEVCMALAVELHTVLQERATPACQHAVLDAAQRFQLERDLGQLADWERYIQAALRNVGEALNAAYVALGSLDPGTRHFFEHVSGSDGADTQGFRAHPLERSPAELHRGIDALVRFLGELSARVQVVLTTYPFQGKGRKADFALRNYVRRLSPIYEAASGTPLTIPHNPYQHTGRVSEGFRFLQACVRPFDPVRCGASAFVSFCKRALYT